MALKDGEGAEQEYVVLIRGFVMRIDDGTIHRMVGKRLGGYVTNVPKALASEVPAPEDGFMSKALWVDKVWRQRLLPHLHRGDAVSSIHAMVGGVEYVSDGALRALFGATGAMQGEMAMFKVALIQR